MLLAVDFYSSKVYVYPMRYRKLILQKLNQFYDEVKDKRNEKTMRLQGGNEFQQVKIKDLNDKLNVKMFTTAVRGGKAFAAEQKIRELMSRSAKLSVLKMKVAPTMTILSSAENMNNVVNEKYGISPNDIEKKSLSSKKFKTLFNFHRIECTKIIHDRLDKYDGKKYGAKKKKLCKDLDVGKKVLILAERIRKKSVPGKFYEQTIQNISYFNKKETITIRNRQKIDKNPYYWVKS